MKVITITKSYNSGKKYHNIVLYDGSLSHDQICEIVEDWCENDPSGANYGYTSDWEYISDPILIKSALTNEYDYILSGIQNLEIKRNLVVKDLSKYTNG